MKMYKIKNFKIKNRRQNNILEKSHMNIAFTT